MLSKSAKVTLILAPASAHELYRTHTIYQHLYSGLLGGGGEGVGDALGVQAVLRDRHRLAHLCVCVYIYMHLSETGMSDGHSL